MCYKPGDSLELTLGQIEKCCDNFGQVLGVVLMNHVACLTYDS
jgi:hypothetical protein